MSIDQMKIDNPIAIDAIPEAPLTVEFPAKASRSLNEVASLPLTTMFWAHTGLFFIAIVALNVFYLTSGHEALLLQYVRPAVYFLLFLFVVRLFNHSNIFFTVICLTVMAVGSLCFPPARFAWEEHMPILFLYIAMLFTWIPMELCLHYSNIARRMPSRNRDAKARLIERDQNFLLIWTIVAAMFVYFSLFSWYRTQLLTIITTTNFIIGFEKARIRSSTPVRMIRTAISQFFDYPNPISLAPGLIATTSGYLGHRPCCVCFPAAALFFVKFSFAFSLVTLPGPEEFVWGMLSIMLTLSFAVVAVGTMARPEYVNPSLGPWNVVVDKLRESKNKHEKNAYFWGFVAADNSPILIDRSVFLQHVHFLGNSGSGKTAIGLGPTIEQSIRFGDISCFVIDLKADSTELLAACVFARQSHKDRTGEELPIRIFAIEQGLMTHSFNPFTTAGWENLSTTDRSSIICAALGLFYGFDYARSHYSAVNSDIVEECLAENPSIESFQELRETLSDLVEDPSSHLSKKRRGDYVHVAQTIEKLASCAALNVTKNSGASQEVLDNQINLLEAFERPGIYYFHLPSITSPFLAPSIARLVAHFLMIAGKASKRTTRVQFMVDEFQRMISENLDQFFQMARSLDVGLVLANQSLSDLKASGEKLFHAIEGNCYIRQWLSATTVEDLQMLEVLFGTQKEIRETTIGAGTTEQVISRTVVDAPRITMTDLHTISDNPTLSVVRITGTRKGYSRYRGIPFVMRSHFHISEMEYETRQNFKWPTDLPGLMEVRETLFTRRPKANRASRSDTSRIPTKKRDMEPPKWDPDLFK